MPKAKTPKRRAGYRKWDYVELVDDYLAWARARGEVSREAMIKALRLRMWMGTKKTPRKVK